MTEEIKFEKAMEKLEKIVDDLETGNIALDEALKKYEEGVKLSRICRERLSQAEKKIEMLTRAADGSLKKQPFDLESAETFGESKPARENRAKSKSAPKAAQDDEEDGLI